MQLHLQFIVIFTNPIGTNCFQSHISTVSIIVHELNVNQNYSHISKTIDPEETQNKYRKKDVLISLELEKQAQFIFIHVLIVTNNKFEQDCIWIMHVFIKLLVCTKEWLVLS
jgi:hypothetical protein